MGGGTGRGTVAHPYPPPAAAILQAIKKDGGDSILLHTPQFPVPLLPELEERGWAWEDVADTPEGSILRLSREPV